MTGAIQRGWQQPRLLNRLLYPLGAIYGAAMKLRRRLYERGFFSRVKLAVPLVVVGNLSVGGVGKTPLVIALVEACQKRGMKPGVITRGYRGRAKDWPREVDANADPFEVGDEPVLIFRRCRVPIIAGPNRAHNARLLIDRHACDIIISDDGFQHLKLARDVDIVVVGESPDASPNASWFGNGWCLPAGPLRELPDVLSCADIVVVNGIAGMKKSNRTTPKEFAMHSHIETAVRIDGARTRKLSEFANQSVHAVAGIANPERFFRQLESHGMRIIRHAYPDHHRFTAADLSFADCDNAAVVMTEKDAVKCEALIPPTQVARWWCAPLGVKLDGGLAAAVFERLAQ